MGARLDANAMQGGGENPIRPQAVFASSPHPSSTFRLPLTVQGERRKRARCGEKPPHFVPGRLIGSGEEVEAGHGETFIFDPELGPKRALVLVPLAPYIAFAFRRAPHGGTKSKSVGRSGTPGEGRGGGSSFKALRPARVECKDPPPLVLRADGPTLFYCERAWALV